MAVCTNGCTFLLALRQPDGNAVSTSLTYVQRLIYIKTPFLHLVFFRLIRIFVPRWMKKNDDHQLQHSVGQ